MSPEKEVGMSPTQEYIVRTAENMERMKKMTLTDDEAQIVAGYLAGCEEMGDALDTVLKFRERKTQRQRAGSALAPPQALGVGSAQAAVDASNARYPQLAICPPQAGPTASVEVQ